MVIRTILSRMTGDCYQAFADSGATSVPPSRPSCLGTRKPTWLI